MKGDTPEEIPQRNFLRIGKWEKYLFVSFLMIHTLCEDCMEAKAIAAQEPQPYSSETSIEKPHNVKKIHPFSPPRRRKKKNTRKPGELSSTPYTAAGGGSCKTGHRCLSERSAALPFLTL